MKKLFAILMTCCVAASFGGNAWGKTKPASKVDHKAVALQTINRATAEAVISFLASDELEGREAGFNGSKVASHYIASQLKIMGIQPLGDSYFQPFEAYSAERQKRTRFYVHPDSIANLQQDVHRKMTMRNVLGMIPGQIKDEYVVVGTHFDHLGIDPLLEGDKIYNGADDNASGVSAVLQIARAFKESGTVPMRNVVFAFWDGEEKGLLGSKYFVQSCQFVDQIKGYLNFDMIGRNNNPEKPEQFDYFYTEAHKVFNDWIKDDIEANNLRLEVVYHPWDRPVGGSDNASFALKEIPIIWYHTNAHPDYHLPSDHADRINYDKVVDITKASFLSAWRLVYTKEY